MPEVIQWTSIEVPPREASLVQLCFCAFVLLKGEFQYGCIVRAFRWVKRVTRGRVMSRAGVVV
jgi:hypothetical protein